MNSDSSRSGESTFFKRSILKAPAVQALAIQFLTFLLILLLFKCIWFVAGINPGIIVAAVLQGFISAIISRWRGLAWWWFPIQFFFPITLLLTHSLHLPPNIYLFFFVLLVGLYWTTFRTQVPYYPSSLAAWNAVSALLPTDRAIRFIDIGSGLGGLVLNLAGRRPEGIFVGIELAPLPWFASWIRGRVEGSRARFIFGDYEGHHFGQYDVVFAYLSPVAMSGLWNKAQREMQSGALLLSYEFPIAGIPPQITIKDESGCPVLYGWHF